MDTRYLDSFCSVVDHGSMAEAARRLNLTPAGVAQRIRALETELGTELLRRVGRHVHPTEAGLAVHARSRELLDIIRDLRHAVTPDAMAGELRLGAISTVMTGILPGVLRELIARYPNFSIHVAPGTSMDLYRRVTEYDLDAALVVEPPFRLPKSCAWKELRRENLVLIAPKGTYMSRPEDVLKSQPLIRYDRNHWGGRLADRYLRGLSIAPIERFELDALEAIAVMVNSGLGVSLVPDWPQPWPEGLQLERKVIDDPVYARRIGLVWTRTGSRTRLIDAFLEIASDHGRSARGTSLEREETPG